MEGGRTFRKQCGSENKSTEQHLPEQYERQEGEKHRPENRPKNKVEGGRTFRKQCGSESKSTEQHLPEQYERQEGGKART